MLATPRSRVEQPGIPTTVVDTIGAGDAFTSALVAGVTRWGLAESLASGALQEPDVEALATVAQRAASTTVARAGAQPPTWAEIIGSVEPESVHRAAVRTAPTPRGYDGLELSAASSSADAEMS